MNTIYEAPGLPASWLNAWLAALGITVLVPDAKLSWTGGTDPVARLHHPDVVGALASAIPDESQLQQLAIARTHPQVSEELPRKVTRQEYLARVVLAQTGDFTLGATLTDLCPDPSDEIAHGPFDPPVPRGITLHERLVRCRREVDDLEDAVRLTLAGSGRRRPFNGLGFDYTRFFSPTDPVGGNWCDPVIELLAFYGLALLPVRGDGRSMRPRGWSGRPSRRGAFRWPTWGIALGAPGVDALLDEFWCAGQSRDVSQVFRSVPYRPRGSADSTRAYASERAP